MGKMRMKTLFRHNMRGAKHTGFTLIEMLVVIAVMLILMALILPALTRARITRLILLAQTEVKNIKAAAEKYYEELGTYPPDTADYGTGDNPEVMSTDPDAIYHYLGRKIRDKNGKDWGPYIQLKNDYLKGDTYVDPWGKPYCMDSMHSIVGTKPGPTLGRVMRCGVPYPPGTESSNPELIKVDLKVWSGGPDGKWMNGSNVLEGRGPEVDDQDNITSWAD
jgi:prepilin-type N-terminal cleavage/methylation domain-containing protein